MFKTSNFLACDSQRKKEVDQDMLHDFFFENIFYYLFVLNNVFLSISWGSAFVFFILHYTNSCKTVRVKVLFSQHARIWWAILQVLITVIWFLEWLWKRRNNFKDLSSHFILSETWLVDNYVWILNNSD